MQMDAFIEDDSIMASPGTQEDSMEEELFQNNTTKHTDEPVEPEEHANDNLTASVEQTEKCMSQPSGEVEAERHNISDDLSEEQPQTRSSDGSKTEAKDDFEESDDPVSGLTRVVIGDEQTSEHDNSGVTSGVHNTNVTESVDVEGKADVLEKEKINEDDNDDGSSLDLGNLVHADEESRNRLFARALVYERKGKQNCALKCYLGCISRLQQDSKFALLPQCLRNWTVLTCSLLEGIYLMVKIADIYYKKEEYDKAICFIQAEKLFYENALIDTTEIQQKLEEIHMLNSETENNEGSGDSKYSKDILRAEEYEHLAKLCVDKKQPQLALEYAGKATKIRQQIFGDDHEITKHSLDYFATLYGEVGRHQYNESLLHLSEDPENSSAEQDGTELNIPSSTLPRSPSGILRQRKTGEDKEKKQVRFEEPQEHSSSDRYQEEWISRALLCVLFAICFLLLLVLGSWLYCNLYSNTFCQSVRDDFNFYVRKINYFYYQYASTKKIKYS